MTQVPPTPTNSSQSQRAWYKSLDGWKALLEVIAIPFAIGYAVITFFQWHDLRHNFAIAERAWIEVKEIPNQIHNTLVMPVTVTNIGKSPALNVYVLSGAEVVQKDKSPSFIYDKTHWKYRTTGIMFQNSTYPPFDAGSDIAVLVEQQQQLSSGSAYVAVYGKVTWSDIFGKSHWDTFCFWGGIKNEGGYNARGCTDYNRTDAD